MPQGTSKAISRSLRTTRRSSEDGRAGFRRADIPTGAPKRRAVRSRIKMRSRVDCHHLQVALDLEHGSFFLLLV